MATPSLSLYFASLLGRGLAFGIRPIATWRLSSMSGRAALLAGYVATGYVTGFAVLMLAL